MQGMVLIGHWKVLILDMHTARGGVVRTASGSYSRAAVV